LISSQSPVTFKRFADLARRRSWTAQFLSERFRCRIQEPLEFFSRVLSDKFKDNVISYRSVIDFYRSAQNLEVRAGPRVCACGCGRVVFDRKKWAAPGCKKKVAREKVRDSAKCPVKVPDFIEARPGQNRQVATLLLTSPETGTNGL